MQFWIVIQAAAAKLLVAVGDRPRDYVAIGVMVKVEVEGNGVIEADIFGVEGFSLNHADRKGDDPSVLPPDEESNLVRHQPAEAAKILSRQLLEVELRSI